jgi:hypothetical protein
MIKHANGDVEDLRLVALDQFFERLTISRAGTWYKLLIFVVGGIVG